MDANLKATHRLSPTAPAHGGMYFTVTSTHPVPTSRLVAFDAAETLVFGRNDDCDVVLPHEGVSRRHATFTRRADHVLVADAGSTNGTLVNGTRITGPRRLAGGDIITMGTVTAVVVVTTAAREQRQVATVSELEDRLDAEVERARRYGRSLALVLLRVGGPTEAVEPYLHGIVKTLRRMDLLAEYGGDELGLLLPETNGAAADAVLARIAKVPSTVSVTTGVAVFPVDAGSAGELVGVAHARLHGIAPRSDHATLTQVIVADPKMQHVMTMVDRVAASQITVLLVGESGVGKEIVAEAIHARSARATQPFVRLNCGALAEELLDSELFGHVEGAFTGAVADRAGVFERANGGTLFLDEVGDLSPAAQAKLLRVLDRRTLTRVGDVLERPIDVRIVAATNTDLEAEVRRGRFREDLVFRVGVFSIAIPPLRDRRVEIQPLAQQFAREAARGASVVVSPAALAALEGYDWPGNVRELRNAIDRAVVLSNSGVIEPEHLPERVASGASQNVGSVIRQRVASVERQAIIEALAAAQGRQSAAARALGISRFALSRLMEKHDLRKK